MSRLRDDIDALDAALADAESPAGFRAPGDEEAWRCGEPVVGPRSHPGRRSTWDRCLLERGHDGGCKATLRGLGERNPGDGRSAFDIVIRVPDFMASYMSRIQTLTRFYDDEAQAHADAAALVDREFPGGSLIAVRPAKRDPRPPKDWLARAQRGDAERDATRARRARRNPDGLPPGKRRDGSSVVSDHGPYTVSAGRIIGTDHVVFYVHEPYAGHSSMRTLEGRHMGQLGTRPLPPEIEVLPGYRAREPGSGAERSAAVRGWHQGQYDDAYRAICAEWPEARRGRRSDGSISLTDRELADLVSPEPWRTRGR